MALYFNKLSFVSNELFALSENRNMAKERIKVRVKTSPMAYGYAGIIFVGGQLMTQINPANAIDLAPRSATATNRPRRNT